MQDLSLHILDIVENAIRAGGKKIVIEILEDTDCDTLTLSIEDNGEGMDEEMVKKALDPFFTTKQGKKTGLGLSLLSQAARQTGGNLKIDSKQGKGTKITALFNVAHPDMKPMGDVFETMAALIASNPATQFILDYKTSSYDYHFDSFE